MHKLFHRNPSFTAAPLPAFPINCSWGSLRAWCAQSSDTLTVAMNILKTRKKHVTSRMNLFIRGVVEGKSFVTWLPFPNSANSGT